MLTDHHREARRTAIVRLLRHSPVRRQQELVRLLKREGHAVTQSSISRDLRELGVMKASDGYVLPDKAELSARTQDKFSAVASFVREVRTAGSHYSREDHNRRQWPPPSTSRLDIGHGFGDDTISSQRTQRRRVLESCAGFGV